MRAGKVEGTVPESTVLKARACRAAKELVTAEGGPAGSDDLIVRADAAGAANLMREVVSLDALDVMLGQRAGDARLRRLIAAATFVPWIPTGRESS
jgi:hypothetical protein